VPADDGRLQIDLRLRFDEAAPAQAEILRVSASKPPKRHDLCHLACKIYDARRSRDRMFGDKLFGEPAWDMLLALYCLPKRGELMTVTTLTYAANVPQATGHRYQKALHQQGLIERCPQGSDLRKRIIRLTPEGRSLLDEYLTRLFDCDALVPCARDDAHG
jgi:DNA-binding MarR family transcriptional regulator